MTSWQPVRRSAIHYKHLALGAHMVERDGWQQPAQYASIEEEVKRLKGAVGLCDVSPLGKISLKGNDLDHYLEATFSHESGLNPGTIQSLTVSHESNSVPMVLAQLSAGRIFGPHPSRPALLHGRAIRGRP